jgi:hypothetical protein
MNQRDQHLRSCDNCIRKCEARIIHEPPRPRRSRTNEIARMQVNARGEQVHAKRCDGLPDANGPTKLLSVMVEIRLAST